MRSSLSSTDTNKSFDLYGLDGFKSILVQLLQRFLYQRNAENLSFDFTISNLLQFVFSVTVFLWVQHHIKIDVVLSSFRQFEIIKIFDLPKQSIKNCNYWKRQIFSVFGCLQIRKNSLPRSHFDKNPILKITIKGSGSHPIKTNWF